MSSSSTFTLPEGVELEIDGDTLNLTFHGDVVLEHDLGRSLGTIRAGGDLHIALPKVTGDIEAGGTLTIDGDIDATRLHASRIELGKQAVTCQSITASETIIIGAATLRVDAIVAPGITLDPKASGRVTVVESNNERGATKIKGGFSLGDYNDMFGNAEEFLAERGIAPLDKSTVAPLTPLPEPEPEEAKTVTSEADDEEDVDDPLSLSLDDLEPLMEQAMGVGDENLHAQLSDALGRIQKCYAGGDMPPAVDELSHLIEQGDYDSLRANITEVWNGLLGFHQQRGIRPNPQVTHAFNMIHNLMQS